MDNVICIRCRESVDRHADFCPIPDDNAARAILAKIAELEANASRVQI